MSDNDVSTKIIIDFVLKKKSWINSNFVNNRWKKSLLIYIINMIIEFIKKKARLILIILVIVFIELTGHGILASLARLLN